MHDNRVFIPFGKKSFVTKIDLHARQVDYFTHPIIAAPAHPFSAARKEGFPLLHAGAVKLKTHDACHDHHHEKYLEPGYFLLEDGYLGHFDEHQGDGGPYRVSGGCRNMLDRHRKEVDITDAE